MTVLLAMESLNLCNGTKYYCFILMINKVSPFVSDNINAGLDMADRPDHDLIREVVTLGGGYLEENRSFGFILPPI